MSALDALGNDLSQQNAAPKSTTAPTQPIQQPTAQTQPTQPPSAPTNNPDRDAVSSMYGPAWKGVMQGLYDWTNRYANDASWGGLDNFNAHMGVADLPTLRARRDAMNAQMSLPAKMSADVAAQYTAPQNILLNRIPYFGGAFQGGGQAAAQAWFADKDPATIAKEGVAGAGAGLISRGGRRRGSGYSQDRRALGCGDD